MTKAQQDAIVNGLEGSARDVLKTTHNLDLLQELLDLVRDRPDKRRYYMIVDRMDEIRGS